MKKYSLLPIVILSYIIAMGQQQTLPPEEKPNIEVTGIAELELVPDEIYISIVLREKNKNNDKWKIETQEDNLLKKLKENGFEPEFIRCGGRSAVPGIQEEPCNHRKKTSNESAERR